MCRGGPLRLVGGAERGLQGFRVFRVFRETTLVNNSCTRFWAEERGGQVWGCKWGCGKSRLEGCEWEGQQV